MPVSMDRFGLCMVGGLALAAALLEGGAKIETFASYCLVPIEEMKNITNFLKIRDETVLCLMFCNVCVY
jgi:repressor of nif and glnA expression